MEDAISQLQDLGVTRGQAKKALARYNNDVARAADFIFSGAALSDDESEANIETDEQMAIRLSIQEDQSQPTPSNNDNLFKETITPPPPAVIAQDEPVQLNKAAHDTEYDSAKWSVIPFKEPTSATIAAPTLTTENAAYTPSPSTTQLGNDSSLTWWKDPENPSERMALDDLPIGLRPPSYNFAYSPVLLQALFHVTAFQEAVLSFRPIPYAWGAPKNYWKGFGEPVPGYIMREVVTKRQVHKPIDTAAAPTRPPVPAPPVVARQEENLISLDSPEDKMAALTLEDDNTHVVNDIRKEDEGENDSDSINEEAAESDLPPLIVESASIEEETIEFEDHVENELQLMPKCLQAVAELQKIFAFLGNSNRLYGSASHFVRALNTKMTSNGWEFSDQTFEAFLETMINCLVEADEQSDNAADVNFVPIFRSLFLLKAKIEYGDDYDDEEVYYLTVSLDNTMNSFYGCLDPLVYESYETEIDSTADPSISDEDEASYKFTTFKQIPPILMIVLENRTAPKKSSFDFKVDKTIFMDRYMIQKKEKALEGFKEMDICRKEIAKSKQEMLKLKGGSDVADKRDVLNATINYFEKKEADEEESNTERFDILKDVINAVKNGIDSRLQDLESHVVEQQRKIDSIFDSDDMKENPYGLRASFHHDGRSGTGHYWAYIWIEPEQSLLEDIPTQGGWFKFCDAIVTAASEEDIENDPVPPFALMYVNESLPRFTKEQLYECIPQELKDFIVKDNDLLAQEIHQHDHPATAMEMDSSLVSTSDDDNMFTEKAASVHVDHNDMDSSATFDDNASVITAVNSQQNNTELHNSELHHYSFTGQDFKKLKDRVNAKIVQVSSYPKDDYRFIQSFEVFLARSQNQLILEHLYLLYSSEKPVEGSTETEFTVDETKSREDNDLHSIWQEYDSYLTIAGMITQAMTYFVQKDFVNALQYLLDSKRVEASWKTQIMLDMDVSNAYPGLDTVSFNGLVEKYGKECLKLLNQAAFDKATNSSYRTKGLEDALRIAHQAQTIIGPDSITNDPIYQSLGMLWLTFTEHQAVNMELTDRQADLLNNLIMTYLEGQSGGSSVAHSRSQSPIQDSDDEDEDSNELLKMPLWQRYQQVCSQSEQLLSTLEK